MLFFQPCLSIGRSIGDRLDNRVRMRQNIDERALTEYLVDALDTNSELSTWGQVVDTLRSNQIYVSTQVRKSTKEHTTGADLGIIISRQIDKSDVKSKSRYACLIQCKKVDVEGYVTDFFHSVGNNTQSSLLLDITPSSFYFLFVPPRLLKMRYSNEPMAHILASRECSIPVWNMGLFDYEDIPFPWWLLSHPLPTWQKRSVSSILVVPALAVEAHLDKKHKVQLSDLIPNALPFWFWFGELLIPGFIGDYKQDVISKAKNVDGKGDEFGVNFSVEINISTG